MLTIPSPFSTKTFFGLCMFSLIQPMMIMHYCKTEIQSIIIKHKITQMQLYFKLDWPF